MKTITEMAVATVEAAGGIDEVKRLADHGWPRTRDLKMEISSRDYEHADDCLTAAVEDAARELELETWQISATWRDAETDRDAIVLTISSQELRDAIQAEAQRVVSEA